MLSKALRFFIPDLGDVQDQLRLPSALLGLCGSRERPAERPAPRQRPCVRRLRHDVRLLGKARSFRMVEVIGISRECVRTEPGLIAVDVGEPLQRLQIRAQRIIAEAENSISAAR